jgi:hypothetical protein
MRVQSFNVMGGGGGGKTGSWEVKIVSDMAAGGSSGKIIFLWEGGSEEMVLRPKRYGTLLYVCTIYGNMVSLS